MATTTKGTVQKRRSKGDGTIFKNKRGGWTARYVQKGIPSKEFTGKTKGEVKKKLDDWKVKVAIQDAIIDNIKIDEYAKKYMYHKELSIEAGRFKESSLDSIEKIYVGHLQNSEAMKKTFRNLTSDDILKTINARKDSLSFSTLKKIYNFWSALIRHAKETGELPLTYNIMNSVELPDESVLPVKTKQMKRISDQFLPLIKEIAMSPSPNRNEQFLYKYGPAIVFLLNTGLRGGELLALKRSARVKVDTRYAIKITQTLSRVKNRTPGAKAKTKLILTKPKYKNSVRTIPLNKEAEFCWNIMTNLYSKNIFHNDLLLASRTGWPPNLQSLRTTFIKICKRAGLPDEYTLHTTRHTFATNIVRKTTNMGELKDAAELIGGSYAVVIKNYLHTDNKKKTNLIDAILEDDDFCEVA
jgi:Site-specific recombinase XerD